MKTFIEIEVTLKGKYKKAQKGTLEDPPWPAYIEDFEVWLGGKEITDLIDENELDKMRTDYLEKYEDDLKHECTDECGYI